jgi:hypothetical protein
MRLVVIQGDLAAADIGGLINAVGAEIQASAAYEFGATRVSIFVGTKYFFRTNDYLGVLVVSTSDGTTQRVDMCYSGGSSGLLGIQLGASTTIEASLFEGPVGLAQSRHLSFRDVTAGPA